MEQTWIEWFAALLLPEHWIPGVRLALEVIAAASVFLAALRPWLAKVPAGPARYWVDAIDRILNFIAVNSRPTGERVALPPKRNSVRP